MARRRSTWVAVGFPAKVSACRSNSSGSGGNLFLVSYDRKALLTSVGEPLNELRNSQCRGLAHDCGGRTRCKDVLDFDRRGAGGVYSRRRPDISETDVVCCRDLFGYFHDLFVSERAHFPSSSKVHIAQSTVFRAGVIDSTGAPPCAGRAGPCFPACVRAD